jgi:hypothetical protein
MICYDIWSLQFRTNFTPRTQTSSINPDVQISQSVAEASCIVLLECSKNRPVLCHRHVNFRSCLTLPWRRRITLMAISDVSGYPSERKKEKIIAKNLFSKLFIINLVTNMSAMALLWKQVQTKCKVVLIHASKAYGGLELRFHLLSYFGDGWKVLLYGHFYPQGKYFL